MTTIAFIGLGAMGAPMAGNLLDAGFALRVYNRSGDRAKPLAERGAQSLASPAEAARGADFVVAMVSDDDASRRVMLGADGVIGAVAAGTVIIDSSTTTPGLSRELAAAARARQAVYLDAPVSGSVNQARQRELVFMVGGDRAGVERARPLFDAMGRLTLHAGDSGAGATIKLVNNMISGTVNAALAEALAVAQSAGVNADVAREVLSEGAGGSRLTRTKIPKIQARDFSPHFQLALMEKDLRYFLALAQDVDQPAPLASLVRSQLQAARRGGLGSLDVCALYLQATGQTGSTQP